MATNSGAASAIQLSLLERRSTTGGPAADLGALMESFIRFLTSMAGVDKKEPVTLTIQCEVRRMIEDLLTGESYKPRLLIRLLTIGDMLTGLLECYQLGTLSGGKQFKAATLAVYISSLQHFHKFLQREPQHLKVAITKEELDKMSVVLSGCLTSLQKRTQLEDASKRTRLITSYCSPGVLGRFLCSETFQDALLAVN